MTSFHKSFCRSFCRDRPHEKGNAVIYVMIVIALFAALSFILSRQTNTGEVGALSREKTEVYANQIIQVSNQVKQGLDQMIWSGARIDDLDFILPTAGAYNTAPNGNKVFHPEGGGLVLPRLKNETISQTSNDPPAAWYLGRFNNVEWTDTTSDDVILVAHQITQPVCERINELLNGSSTIPATTSLLRNFLIDDVLHGGTNVDFTTINCGACDGQVALCVQNGGQYSYYNIIAQQ